MRKKICDNCQLIFFHITADSILMDHFTKGFMEDGPLNAQIAGAGSGIPVDGTMGRIAYEDEFYGTGVVAMCISGEDLHVDVKCISGLVRISEYYTATKADDSNIYELDNKPALDVYSDFLGFENDNKFWINAWHFRW